MNHTAGGKSKGIKMAQESFLSTVMRWILVAIFDIGAIWFIYNAFSREFMQLGTVITVITVMINLIFLISKAYPFRWIAVGLSFMILFTIYPIIFTIYVAFTNYGDGHLLTREMVIQQLSTQLYLPESGKSYSWTAYKSPQNIYALWLVNPAGESFLAKPGEEILPAKPGDPGIGEADAKGIPQSIEGYTRLNVLLAASDKNLPNIKFGKEGVQSIQIRSPSEAAELAIRYVYDAEKDAMIDQSNGDIYKNVEGTFSTNNGKTLSPGFRTVIGFKNFVRFVTSPALPGTNHDLEFHFPIDQCAFHLLAGVGNRHHVQ
jgi:arabinogalactan oligomer/maltooligosaccharide transport system permease protein